MITTLTFDSLQEFAPHEFYADASDLGWPPGHFPTAIATTIGNRQVLVLERVDTVSVLYQQELGCVTVRIFND